MVFFRCLGLVLSIALLPAASFAQQAAAPAAAQVAATCEHGVKKSLCTRCNPKLEPVFKAQADWCGEHARPESQCVICHPDLAEKGIK